MAFRVSWLGLVLIVCRRRIGLWGQCWCVIQSTEGDFSDYMCQLGKRMFSAAAIGLPVPFFCVPRLDSSISRNCIGLLPAPAAAWSRNDPGCSIKADGYGVCLGRFHCVSWLVLSSKFYRLPYGLAHLHQHVNSGTQYFSTLIDP